jgi:hypothetical protein
MEMTWKDLKARLSDPIVAGGLLLLVIGEIQRQSDVLLSWLGPQAAGVVLSMIGIAAMVIRHIQALSALKGESDVSQDSGV